MKKTPQQILTVLSLLALSFAVISLYLALQAPMLGVALSATDKGLTVTHIDADSPNKDTVSLNQTWREMNGIPLTADLLIEEPDQLNNWSAYQAFFQNMTHLTTAANQNRLSVVTDQDQTFSLNVRDRGLSDLPLLFWFQVCIGICGFLIATSVYAFRPQDRGAFYFALAGLGLLTFSLAAAVYSTREFMIDGDIAQWLSYTNQMGAIFFTAALVALLATYPKKLVYSKYITIAAFVSWLIIWGGFVSAAFSDIATVYLLTLLLFAASFILAYIQWRQTATLPVQRAALKWFLLSIYIGTGLFAALILIPVALEITPPASQGLMFMVFLFMFIGIAMGITRYRLFDLDRWWFAAWSWFLGGLMVIVVDLLLVSLVGLEQSTSLALSLAVIGWGYFPVRQWLFNRLQKAKRNQYQQASRLIERLFSAESPDQLGQYWRKYIDEEWSPLSIQLNAGQIQATTISDDAQSLKIPYFDQQHHLLLQYPNKGSRLFNHHDVESLTYLYALAQKALLGLQVRNQAIEEKRRILADLHDDVGSKLLSLLHRSEDSVNYDLARNALRDLREVVSQPDHGLWLLSDKLSDWRLECTDRLKARGIKLHWHQYGIHDHNVSYSSASHLARILREAINNVLKHSQASEVNITTQMTEQNLQMIIQDNGQGQSPSTWTAGRGISNIRFRVEKLNGQVSWSENEGGGILLKITLPTESL